MFSRVSFQRTAWHAVAIAACALLSIAFDHGIHIGQENHAGMLPVVRRLLDAQYLPGDFGIGLRLHHHRVFATLVAALAGTPLGERGALVLLTVAGAVLAFAALWELAASLGLGWAGRLFAGVALALSFAYLDHGVEANLLLGNGPIMPPTFAHAFILLSTAAVVRGRWNAALAWTGAAALLHLQIGALWLLVLILAAGWRGAWRLPATRWLPGLLAMLVVVSPALLDAAALMREGLVRHIGDMSDASLRMPQHFIFYGNRIAAVAVYLAALCLLGRRWRRRRDPRGETFGALCLLSTIIAALMAAHYLDYYWWHLGWVARLQPLRLSPLLPVYGALAIVAAIEGAPPVRSIRRQRWLAAAALFLVVADGAAGVARGRPPTLAVHLNSGMGEAWVDVCRWIDRAGPAGLYVTPPGETGFTSLSNRSTLVEFKINPDGGAGLAEWLRRLKATAGGSLPPASSRRDVGEALDAAYARLSPEQIEALARDYGVRYAVLPTGAAAVGRELYRNREYRVVALEAAGAGAP